MNTRDKLTLSNGIEMTFFEMGTRGMGEDILISHGALFNGNAMAPYGLEFSKENHVIVMDLPSHFTKDNKDPKTFSELVESVALFIEALKENGYINKKPIFQGWSLGGSVALAVATLPKELLKAAVMISSDYFWECDLGEVDSEEAKLNFVTYIVDNSQSVGIPDSKTQEIKGNFPDILANYYTCTNDSRLSKTINLTNQLDQVHIPVIIICGERDILTTVEKQEKLQRSLQQAKLEILKGCTHAIVLEDPKLVADTFKKLL